MTKSPAPSRDSLANTARWAKTTTIALTGLVAAFCGWAAMAKVEEVTRGEGKIIPASRIQIVQNLEGGIVRQISTKEGAVVNAGDVIINIDTTGAGSSFEERREKLIGLRAVVARLSAQAEGTALAMPDDILTDRPKLAHEQQELYTNRIREIEAALAGFDLQASQRRQEIVEVKAKIQNLTKSVQIAKDEIDLTRPLVQRGAAARIELIRLEARLNETSGALEAATLAVPRVEQALAEVITKRREKELNEKAEVRQQLAEARVQTSALEQSIKGDADRVERADVRAPVTGLVKTLHVSTIGQIIKPGMDIVEIVPTDSALIVEARVRPQDIAFLRPNLDAIVRLSAYDYTLYGTLKAKVEHIGADSITTEKGETYYLVRARTDRAQLQKDGKNLPILPGMVASMDILTGEKTILNYLLRPLSRMRNEALRER
ncbi:MAG: HlyD family type I secretion periplasmic adaptor subunit [Beijerinckiaceae bacterium]